MRPLNTPSSRSLEGTIEMRSRSSETSVTTALGAEAEPSSPWVQISSERRF